MPLAVEVSISTRTSPLAMVPIYGAVYKAKCDQLPCAAKVLHPTILDPRGPGSDRIMQQELMCLS